MTRAAPTSFRRLVLLASLGAVGACVGGGAESEPDEVAPLENTQSAEEGLTCTVIDPGGFFKYIEDVAIANDPLDPSKANANYGMAPVMYTGSAGTEQRRILMKFDLTGAGISWMDSIVSASLDLRMAQSLGQAPVNVHAGTSVWSELTATWSTIAATPGGGLGSLLVSAPTAGIPTNGHLVINLPTATVATWLNSNTNYGIVLDHPALGRTLFGSEQAPLGLRPLLTVCHQAPTCFDGVQNGGESDVDCGVNNYCVQCAVGQGCFQNADCLSDTCVAGTCIPAPTCSDGLLNQQETGVDCGGSCAPCGNGSPCVVDTDCTSGTCVAGTCAATASCVDGILNQGESDVDCGGPCGPCAIGESCIQASDCSSAFCLAGICSVAPTCADGVQNQGETGVDCGGPCASCPSCNDGIQNQGETGVDCGGQCVACPSCNDGLQNQGETGVDCGGPCAACVAGGAHLLSKAFGSANGPGTGMETISASGVDASGNIYVAAWAQGSVDLGAGPMAHGGATDMLIAKYTSAGALVWGKMIGGPSDELVFDMAVSPAGDVYVSGTTAGTTDFGNGPVAPVGQGDGFVVKYNTSGGFVWHRPIASVNYDEVRAVTLDAAGNVIFAGERGSLGFVQKVSASNVGAWSRAYAAGPGGWVTPNEVKVNGNNEVTFVGYYGGSPDFGGGALPNVPFRSVGFVVKLSSLGAHVFSKALVDTSNDLYAWDVAQDGSGNIVIYGSCNGAIDYGAGSQFCLGIYLLKLDGAGAPSWYHSYYAYGGLSLRGLECDAAGNIFAAGGTLSIVDFGGGPIGTNPAANRADAFVIKLDPSAGVLWQRAILGVPGSYRGAEVESLALDPQGGVVVTGDFDATVDFGGGSFTPLTTNVDDCWFAKYAQ